MAWGYGNSGSGGGLNATDAVLRVIVKAGSTVTITKGSYHKTDTGHENHIDNTLYDYYFVIHASQFDSSNPWTVTATLGTETVTQTIIIDSPDEYDFQLYYPLYIIKNGILDPDAVITKVGKKSNSSSSSTEEAPSSSNGDGYIQIGYTSNTSSGTRQGIAYISSYRVVLSKYNHHVVVGTAKNNSSYTTNLCADAWTSIGDYIQSNRLYYGTILNDTSASGYVSFTKDMDISTDNDTVYVGFNFIRGPSYYTSIRVQDLYFTM